MYCDTVRLDGRREVELDFESFQATWYAPADMRIWFRPDNPSPPLSHVQRCHGSDGQAASRSPGPSLVDSLTQVEKMAPRTIIAFAVGLARPAACRGGTKAWHYLPGRTAMSIRTYATHTGKPSSFASSSSSLAGSSSASSSSSPRDPRVAELFNRLESEAQRRAAREAMGGGERVGPFPLGVGPSGRNKTWRKWSELGIGGKRQYSLAS